MKKRATLFTTAALLAAGIFAWQVPRLLKAVPSRYVAALPAPLQQLGVREHATALPTAAPVAEAGQLLLGDGVVPASPGQEEPSLVAELPPAPTFEPPLPPTSPALASQALPTAAPTASPAPTATPTPTPIPFPSSARLYNIQHAFQDWNNCGPATIATALSYYGLNLTQYQVANVLKPNPEDRNVSPWELSDYVNNNTSFAALDRTNGDMDTLRRLVSSGFPVMIEVGIDPPGEYAWLGWYGHYLLVVAYDDSLEQVWVYDSWLGTSEVPRENANNLGRVWPYADIDNAWRQFNRNYIVAYPREDAGTVAAIIGDNLDDALMWQRSLARIKAELSAEQDNPYLWFDLGTNYNAVGDYQKAAIAFDQARNIGLPWRMLWYQFGPYEAYYQVGRYEDVVLLADVTLQDRPYFEESYYYKGMALAQLGELDEARRNLQKATAFNPGYVPAAQALAQLQP